MSGFRVIFDSEDEVHLLDDRSRLVHGLRFEHGGPGELAAFASFPFVVLLYQDRACQARSATGLGNAPKTSVSSFIFLLKYSSGMADQIWRQYRCRNDANARRSCWASSRRPVCQTRQRRR